VKTLVRPTIMSGLAVMLSPVIGTSVTVTMVLAVAEFTLFVAVTVAV
jgi:hypothetical protein